jgi:hypothetical protein
MFLIASPFLSGGWLSQFAKFLKLIAINDVRSLQLLKLRKQHPGVWSKGMAVSFEFVNDFTLACDKLFTLCDMLFCEFQVLLKRGFIRILLR